LPAIGPVLQATPGYCFFQARLAWRSHRLEFSSLPQKEDNLSHEARCQDSPCKMSNEQDGLAPSRHKKAVMSVLDIHTGFLSDQVYLQ